MNTVPQSGKDKITVKKTSTYAADLLPREMDDVVQAARGRPGDLLIPGSDDLTCVVELVEMRLARAGRVDMDGEIVSGPVPGKDHGVVREDAGQLDWIAVRPVQRPGNGALLLLENEFEPDVFYR